MGSTTILCGFRVSVIALDNFLRANGVYETYGKPPFLKEHPDKDPISILLYNKLVGFAGDASMIDKNDYRVAIPHVQGYQTSRVAYVTYAWQVVWAHREIDLEKLPAEPPEAFEQLRNEIMSFGEGLDDEERIPDDGKLGLYAVHTYEIRGSFTPQELIDRHKVSNSGKKFWAHGRETDA